MNTEDHYRFNINNTNHQLQRMTLRTYPLVTNNRFTFYTTIHSATVYAYKLACIVVPDKSILFRQPHNNNHSIIVYIDTVMCLLTTIIS